MARRGQRAVKADFNEIGREASKNGWSEKFKCYDNPAEYADYQKAPSPERAKEMCAGCPMLRACREYAVVTGETWGVWGGVVMTEKNAKPRRTQYS